MPEQPEPYPAEPTETEVASSIGNALIDSPLITRDWRVIRWERSASTPGDVVVVLRSLTGREASYTVRVFAR